MTPGELDLFAKLLEAQARALVWRAIGQRLLSSSIVAEVETVAAAAHSCALEAVEDVAPGIAARIDRRPLKVDMFD